MKKIFLFMDTWRWLAQHSGYHRLYDYITQYYPHIQAFHTRYGCFYRVLGKMYSITQGWPVRNQNEACAELLFQLMGHPHKKNYFYHFLYFESHSFLWERKPKWQKNCIATIHHPWPRPIETRLEKAIEKLSGAIILSNAGFDWYENKVGQGRVWVIPHGIDTDFFVPAVPELDLIRKKDDFCLRWLFVGHNGRDTDMLERVISKLNKIVKGWRLDCILPSQYRHSPGLKKLRTFPNVFWHENLSDIELRQLYQNSYLMIMPMRDCSANNAILEALACGTPIITTNIGGIPDYGGGKIFPMVDYNKDDDMVDLVLQYIQKPNWREEIAQAQRNFARIFLDWKEIARQHWKIYAQFLEEL